MNVFRSSVKDINGIVLEETDITLKKGKKHNKKKYYKEFILKLKFFLRLVHILWWFIEDNKENEKCMKIFKELYEEYIFIKYHLLDVLIMIAQ